MDIIVITTLVLMFAAVHMRGPGRVQVHLSQKALTTVLVLNLFCRNPIVYFKEKYNFPSLQRGSNIFQGGGDNCLIPIKTHITCAF